MRRRVSGVIVALAASLASAGCWLTTSFDELSCAGTCDAGSAAGGEGGATPSAEAGAESGATPGDAGAGCDGALICDDFEQGLVAPWSSVSGSVQIDGTKSHSGSQALHVTAAGSAPAPGEAMIGSHLPLAAPFYVRLFAFVPSSPIASEPDPTTNVLVRLTRAGSFDTMQLRIEGAPGSKDFGIADNTSNRYVTSSVAYPFDRWACVEWFVGTGSTRLWSEGAEISALDLPVASSEFVTLDVGWASSSNQAARPLELWIDDVVVSPNRVGCN